MGLFQRIPKHSWKAGNRSQDSSPARFAEAMNKRARRATRNLQLQVRQSRQYDLMKGKTDASD